MNILNTTVHLIHPYPLECEAVAEWLSKKAFIHFNGKSRNLEGFATLPGIERVEMIILFAYNVKETATQILNIRKTHPDVKFVVVSGTFHTEVVREIIHCGVNSYISVDAGVEEWEWAIKSVSEGRIYYGQEVMKQLAGPFINIHSSQPEPAEKTLLSKRETEILRLVASEYSTNRIAEQLFISGKTVETHRRNIFQKLGVKNSVGLTKIAVRLGVI